MNIYETKKIGEIISKDKEIFEVFVGLDKNMVQQLKKYSLDETDVDLQKNTGDKERFGLGSYEDWYKKDRNPFALIHRDTNILSALVWLGPKPIGKMSIKFGVEQDKIEQQQDGSHTMAIRSYSPFRGKGITKVFCNFVLDFYKKENPGVFIWGGMDNRNEAVIRLMSHLGFEKREDASDVESNWLIMVKEL